MGKKEPLRFSKLPNAIVIQGTVDKTAYDNFVKNKDNNPKIGSVKTIYIEKDANILCEFKDFEKVTRVVLRGDPKCNHPPLGRENSWLPISGLDKRTLDVSALSNKCQTDGQLKWRWTCWGCGHASYSPFAELKIRARGGVYLTDDRRYIKVSGKDSYKNFII